MLLEISQTNAIWQIMLITVLINIFSRWFTKKFSISQESQMNMQADIKDLQDRMKYAKGDTAQMEQLNAEMMVVMKTMSKKQMIPMLIRSLVFFGIWGLLGLIYGDWKEDLLPFDVLFGSGYAGLYITFSLVLSIGIMLVKLGFKKMNPEIEDKKENVIDQAKVLRSNIIFANEEPKDEVNDYNPSGSNKKWKQQLKNGN
jgi:uncharacterized membrane protein (DUF106 family)